MSKLAISLNIIEWLTLSVSADSSDVFDVDDESPFDGENGKEDRLGNTGIAVGDGATGHALLQRVENFPGVLIGEGRVEQEGEDDFILKYKIALVLVT